MSLPQYLRLDWADLTVIRLHSQIHEIHNAAKPYHLELIRRDYVANGTIILLDCHRNSLC